MLFRTAIFLFLFLAGCGFQLRGVATVPIEMTRTYIDTGDRHSLFYRRIRSGFRNAGIQIVDSPKDASAIFFITSDQTGQRVLSVSARNVPTEFEVYYSIGYRLSAGETVLLPPRTQTLIRDYTWDETLVLGKEKEEQLLRDAIVDDLIRIILIQLYGI